MIEWADDRSEFAEQAGAEVSGLAIALLDWLDGGGDARLGVRAVLRALGDGDERLARSIRRIGVDAKAVAIPAAGRMYQAIAAWAADETPVGENEFCRFSWLRTTDPGAGDDGDRAWTADAVDVSLAGLLAEAVPWMAEGGSPELLVRYVLAVLSGVDERLAKAIRRLGCDRAWLHGFGHHYAETDATPVEGESDLAQLLNSFVGVEIIGPALDELDPGATPRAA